MTETENTTNSAARDAGQTLTDFGICVDSDRLSDGSKVWNVLTSEAEINCLSERHARELAFAIAVAIRNATA